jgi:hypothetical protein
MYVIPKIPDLWKISGFQNFPEAAIGGASSATGQPPALRNGLEHRQEGWMRK